MFSRNQQCRIGLFESIQGRIVYLENEVLRVGILADKGTDIVEFLYKPRDIDLMWRGPFPTVPIGTPSSISSKLGGFLDYYPGGWQEVFPNAGTPCEYKGAQLGLHGEISLLPWKVEIVEDTPEKISVRFVVHTRRVPFQVEKVLSLSRNSTQLLIEETITNEAGEIMDFLWGHHPALGEPFLSEDCLIEVEASRVSILPGDGQSVSDLLLGEYDWPVVPGKKEGTFVDLRKVPPSHAKVSDVMFLSGLSDGKFAILNPSINLGFLFEFPKEIFQYIWIWRVARGSFHYPWFGRTYNLALEPFSSLPNLTEAIKRKDQLTLNPGETLSATCKASIIPI
jgi:galactose mutarotase-like enzyme